MKNLIRSKEEQLRKQEAEIAKKTHEKALHEQFFSQTPKDFASVICGPAIHAQIHSVNKNVLQQNAYLEILVIFTQTNEIIENRDVQPFH